MAAYCQEVRKHEEKFDGFKLRHILRQDNEADNALVRLRSSHEPPPLGVFMQDLIKPSIRLEKDSPAPMLGAALGKDGPTLGLGTPSGKGSLAPTSETDPGTPVGPTGQAWELGVEIVAINGLLGSDTDWKKSIFGYLRLRTMPNDETETRCLTRQAKGYLIHDNELCRDNTSGILQRCIPVEEGKALLLNIHKGICEHHASSKRMVGKVF
jgi:hypothetical protein